MTTQMNSLDPYAQRTQFPALQRQLNGRPVSFLDGPGGTQVPQSVIDAMSGFLANGSSNLGAPFLTSREAVTVTDNARLALQAVFGE